MPCSRAECLQQVLFTIFQPCPTVYASAACVEAKNKFWSFFLFFFPSFLWELCCYMNTPAWPTLCRLLCLTCHSLIIQVIRVLQVEIRFKSLTYSIVGFIIHLSELPSSGNITIFIHFISIDTNTPTFTHRAQFVLFTLSCFSPTFPYTSLYVPVVCSFLLYEPISIISRQQTAAEFPPRCGLARSECGLSAMKLVVGAMQTHPVMGWLQRNRGCTLGHCSPPNPELWWLAG